MNLPLILLAVGSGLYGIFSAYPFEEKYEVPQPPEGYTACHISAYARHGARNYTRAASFDKLHELLMREESLGGLTPAGVKFLDSYDKVYPKIRGCGGDLSAYGQWQHSTHAERMLKDYPEVFRTRSKVSARSTQKPRAMMSMAAFCTRMAGLRPDLDISLSANSVDAWTLEPNSKGNPHLTPADWTAALEAGPHTVVYDSLKLAKWHPDRLFGTFFKDWTLCREIDQNPLQAEKDLYYTICSCYDNDPSVDLMSLCPKEEMQAVWEVENYRMYNTCFEEKWTGARNTASAEMLLWDFILRAGYDLEAGSGKAACLRFGHDYQIAMLMRLMQIDFVYDINFIPMASVLQWTFYRNESGHILLRISLNNNNLSLPIPAVKGPFYDWNQARKYFVSRVLWAYGILGVDG